jgi:hypothetical protein
MNVSVFVILATVLYTSSSKLGGLQRISTRRDRLLEIILDMLICGDFIYTRELSRPAALA